VEQWLGVLRIEVSFLQLLLLGIKSFCGLKQLTTKRFRVHGGIIPQNIF